MLKILQLIGSKGMCSKLATQRGPCICLVAINTSYTYLSSGLCHLSIARENKMGPECLGSGLLLMGVTLSSVVTKSSALFCGFNALCLHFSFSLGDLIALAGCHHKYFGLWSSCLQSICARSQYKNSFSAQLGFWPQSCFASNPCWLMNTCVPPVMGPCVEAQWGRLLPYCLCPLWRSWCVRKEGWGTGRWWVHAAFSRAVLSSCVLLFPLHGCGRSTSQRPDFEWVGCRSCGSTIAAV